MVRRLGVLKEEAVQQNQRLSEITAANGHVSLNAVGRAAPRVDGWIEAQKIEDGASQRLLIGTELDRADGTVGLFERNRLEGTGDYGLIELLGWLVRRRLRE